ncbi:MAG: autotransporter outer membrane beta-barrel domain-containing protein [Bacteroidota bacterium]
MYKKLLLAFVSIIAIQSAKAQTEKGSQMLGVSFGVSTSSSDSKYLDYSTNAMTNVHGKATSYSIAPTYSYFVADKLDLGLSIGYGQSKQDYSSIYNPSNTESNGFNAGIYLRKYFLYENKIGIRTGPMFNYQHGKSIQEYASNPQSNSENISNTYSGGLGLDFVYFPIKRLGLTAALGGLTYAHQDVKGTTPSSTNSFDANFINRFVFSINYAFGN